ncbi:hypothetical protein GCM10010198_21420 [Nocardia seriolae]|nr:hypothetical protein NSERKGN1266_79550 [Nocardia seriolae]BEK99811.1 hypothetical protein NSER024013_77170 [Nocardia seriolae]GEM24868.1 hypothetical protein NS2_31070 [Nocardia seriolae NBRC 15557]
MPEAVTSSADRSAGAATCTLITGSWTFKGPFWPFTKTVDKIDPSLVGAVAATLRNRATRAAAVVNRRRARAWQYRRGERR